MPNLLQRPRLLWGLLALAVAIVAATAWRWDRTVEVVAAPTRLGSVTLQVNGPGTVQARTAVAVASRITSHVIAVHADVGDSVESGQLLVTLDDREAQARLAATRGQQLALTSHVEAARAALGKAEAELAMAQSRQRRDADLHRQGFVSPASLDVSGAGWQVAHAGVQAARATLAARRADADTVAQEVRAAESVLSHARLHAPFAGVVTQRLAEPGSTVGIGTPILKLVDPATLWVATRIDESVLDRVALGQNARIRLRSGEALNGKVTRIARQSDAATRELDVFVSLERLPKHFAIDQEAAVTIDTGEAEGWVIPASALTQNSLGQPGVLVVTDDRAVFRQIRSNGSDGQQISVIEGLSDGERVVIQPQHLRANPRVRVR